MGLQAGTDDSKGNVTFLSVAGGYIWDKSVEKGHKLFKVQEYAKLEGEVGSRQGARYDALSGIVTDVNFEEHEQYGESIRVSINSEGVGYIISIQTNNRNSQDFMKALLKMNFQKELLIAPYDTNNWSKKQPKRNQGIKFTQGGEKIDLRNDDAPFETKEFFDTASQKKKKRYFDDLTEWFVDKVKELVDTIEFLSPKVDEKTEEEAPEKEAPKKETPKKEKKSKKEKKAKKSKKADEAEDAKEEEQEEGESDPADEMPDVDDNELDGQLESLMED
jgi:hypothetical protein